MLGHWHEVVGLYQELQRDYQKPSIPPSVRRTVLIGLGKLGQFKDAARMVKEIENLDKAEAESLYQILIPLYVKGRDVNNALRCLRRMRDRELKGSSRMFAHLTAGLSLQVSVFDHASLQSHILKHQIDTDTDADFLLNLTTSYSSLGFVSDALESLRQLRRVSGDKNILLRAYSSVIDACLKSGFTRDPVAGLQEARNLFSEMMADSIAPNVKTFTSFLYHYYRTGGLHHLNACLKEMKNYGLKPDQHVYNILIRTYTLANKPDLAISKYQELISDGLAPNIRVLTSTIAAYAVVGDVERMRTLFEEVAFAGATPDHSLFHAMMNGYANLKDLTACLEWYDRLLSAGLRPDVITYTIVMYAVAKSIDSEAMGRWFEKLFSADVKPNVYTYSLIMHEKSKKRGELAAVMHILDDMVNAGVSPTPVTYTILSNAFLRHNLNRTSLRAVHHMLSEGSRPDAVVLYTAMKAFNKAGQHNKAIQTYKRLKDFDVEPTDLMDYILFASSLEAKKFPMCDHAVQSVLSRLTLTQSGSSSSLVVVKIALDVYKRRRRLRTTLDDESSKRHAMKKYLDGLFDSLLHKVPDFPEEVKFAVLSQLLEAAVLASDKENVARFFKCICLADLIHKVDVVLRHKSFQAVMDEEQGAIEMVALSTFHGNRDDVVELGIFSKSTPPARIIEIWSQYGEELVKCQRINSPHGPQYISEGAFALESSKFSILLQACEEARDSMALGQLWSSLKYHPAAPRIDISLAQTFLKLLSNLEAWKLFLHVADGVLSKMERPEDVALLNGLIADTLSRIPEDSDLTYSKRAVEDHYNLSYDTRSG
ncbi:hypothetical protein HDU96_007375 [Phlyctochytrium bullatum]|nr:hypothetical protein HDU96_007375 [Phlyctochytrium bullatum]